MWGHVGMGAPGNKGRILETATLTAPGICLFGWGNFRIALFRIRAKFGGASFQKKIKPSVQTDFLNLK